MIEINLLPGQKRKAPGGGGLRLPNFGALLTQVKDPWLLGAIAAFVIGIGGNAAIFLLTTATLAQKNHTLEGVRVENRRYEGYVAKKRNSERVRDSLSAEMTASRARARNCASSRRSPRSDGSRRARLRECGFSEPGWRS